MEKLKTTLLPNKVSIIYVLLLALFDTYVYNWRVGLTALGILPLGMLIEYTWYVATKTK